ALKTNSTLTTLYLWGNSIGPNGAQALSEALKTNSTLITLGKILVLYNTEGKFNVDGLPEVIVCFRSRSNAGVVKTLQQRYHMLQDQEVELVLATEDKVAITGLLIRIRILMHEIEKAMFKARPFQLLSLPRCLSSRYIEGSGASLTAPALLKRYSTLKQHEFRIALTDIQWI
ncbi:hypothetical protein BGZ59_007806, partial [Podila verticillata]